MNRYANNTFTQKYKVTLGSDFLSKEEIIGDEVVTLQVWDTAGQEKYRGLSKIFYRGADLCFLVFDLSKRESFKNINNWKQACMDFNTTAYMEKGGFLPFILLGNKSDLQTRDVKQEEILNFCQEHEHLKYYEVSAKEGTKIAEVFHEASEIITNYKNM